MRLIINIILLALIAGLVYLLATSINEPIKFGTEKNKRKNAVVSQLMKVRTLQEFHRSITGEFASDFDSLKHTLETGRFRTIKVFGDPDDPTNTEAIRYDTTYKNAIDAVIRLGINLDSVRFIPYTDGGTFEMEADTIIYQSTLVPVVECGTQWKNFMGKYGSSKFSRYDNRYDPENYIKFGDLSAPNLTGNWEQ